EARALAERPIGEAFDDHPDAGADGHRKREDDDEARLARKGWEPARQVVAGEGPQHEDLGVREVDELQHAVDHRVAQRDEGVDRTQGKTVDEVLEELGHGSIAFAKVAPRLRISSTTAGFTGLWFSSMVMVPVTPRKSRVVASA